MTHGKRQGLVDRGSEERGNDAGRNVRPGIRGGRPVNRGSWCGWFGSRGFTIMEAVVVTGVMVVLVGGAVVSYGRMVNKAESRVERQNQELIRKAIFDFYTDRGRYPDTLEELTPGPDGRGYLVRVPVNPKTGSPDWRIIRPQGATVGVSDVAPASSASRGGPGKRGR